MATQAGKTAFKLAQGKYSNHSDIMLILTEVKLAVDAYNSGISERSPKGSRIRVK